MLVVGLLPKVLAHHSKDRPAFISQAKVEELTGFDRETIFRLGGIADEVEGLDLLFREPGEPGQPMADAWELGEGQFSATTMNTSNSSNSNSSSSNWYQEILEDVRACSRELSREEQENWTQAVEPDNDLWHRSWAYGPELWRLAVILGPHDVLLRTSEVGRALSRDKKAVSRLIKHGQVEGVIGAVKGPMPGTVRWLGHFIAQPRLIDTPFFPRPGFGRTNRAQLRNKVERRRFDDMAMIQAMVHVRANLPGLRAAYEAEPDACMAFIAKLAEIADDDVALRALLRRDVITPIEIHRDNLL